jgi:hypothetical protein
LADDIPTIGDWFLRQEGPVIAEWIADHFRTCVVSLAVAIGLSFWIVVRGEERSPPDQCDRLARGTLTHQAPASDGTACMPIPSEAALNSAEARRTEGGLSGERRNRARISGTRSSDPLVR